MVVTPDVVVRPGAVGQPGAADSPDAVAMPGAGLRCYEKAAFRVHREPRPAGWFHGCWSISHPAYLLVSCLWFPLARPAFRLVRHGCLLAPYLSFQLALRGYRLVPCPSVLPACPSALREYPLGLCLVFQSVLCHVFQSVRYPWCQLALYLLFRSALYLAYPLVPPLFQSAQHHACRSVQSLTYWSTFHQ